VKLSQQTRLRVLIPLAIVLVLMALWSIYEFARTHSRQSQDLIASLSSVVQGADTVTLRAPLFGDPDEEFPQLFQADDATQTAALIKDLKVTRFGPRGCCGCFGDVIFEFRSGDELLAKVSFHHQQNLRWAKWENDVQLTRSSAAALVKWVCDNTADKDLLRRIGYIE
jgi:hypothetical protein